MEMLNVKLLRTGRKQRTLHKKENYFDFYGRALPKFLANKFIKGNAKSVKVLEYEVRASETFCAAFSLYFIYLIKII